jgi:hypothetical protein
MVQKYKLTISYQFNIVFVPQEVTQSAKITFHEAEVTNLNHPFPSYVYMSKKKKKKEFNIVLDSTVLNSNLIFIGVDA